LCPNLTTLWGWDQQVGLIEEYTGPEIVFCVNYSTNNFYNNVGAAEVHAGGNWLHMLYTGQIEKYPLSPSLRMEHMLPGEQVQM